MSASADRDAMGEFEVALAACQADLGIISQDAATEIATAIHKTAIDEDAVAVGFARDGVAVPTLVKAWRKALPDAHKNALHLGTTSQDLVDTSLMLRAKKLFAAWNENLSDLIAKLDAVSAQHGHISVMARTRMQDAMEMPLRHRLVNWRDALVQLRGAHPTAFPLQLAGPDGTGRNLLGDQTAQDSQIIALRAAVSKRLGLSDPEHAWHTNRQPAMALGAWCANVTGTLGKIGQDIAIMAQNPIGEARIQGGGGSSAMPHKNNPVAAEWLVSLARQNAGLVGTLHQALISENERSGAAWTLEWLTLPPMFAATDCALHHAGGVFKQMRF